MKLIVSLFFIILIFCSCQKAGTTPEFPWKPYSKAAIEESIAQKKPIVIDFSADWCPNCHELDREVFSRPDIQAKLAKVTALRMDATNQDDPNIQQILQDYAIEGVPTVIFLDSHGKEIDNSRVIGFVTPEEFMQSLALFDLLK